LQYRDPDAASPCILIILTFALDSYQGRQLMILPEVHLVAEDRGFSMNNHFLDRNPLQASAVSFCFLSNSTADIIKSLKLYVIPAGFWHSLYPIIATYIWGYHGT
jgi:hypothetical protein